MYKDIVIEEKTGVLRRINEKQLSFMTMQHPLLFPYAEDGYRSYIEYRKQENPTDDKRICDDDGILCF